MLAEAYRQAQGVSTQPCAPLAIDRWDSDLVWPAAINRGGGQFAFPPDPWTFRIDSTFSFCSHRCECIATSKKVRRPRPRPDDYD